MIPRMLPICLDEHHARHVGRTRDGRQFFVTTPFVPKGPQGEERNFVATFLFDDKGRLIEDRIDEVGPRPDGRVPPGNVDHRIVAERLAAHVAALGEVDFEDIEVAPFQVTRFGVEFGLIPLVVPPEHPEDEAYECVELHPGNYMAFHEPWDGDYDT